PKYISDIVKEVLDDNQDYQDSFEQEKTHSLTTSEAITSPRTRRTSSLVPKATTPIRAGRIAFLVPDVVTSP
ncbi:1316_t:CDS:1, partial [Rhizophagus irregularis]